jgi:hypothetical protein
LSKEINPIKIEIDVFCHRFRNGIPGHATRAPPNANTTAQTQAQAESSEAKDSAEQRGNMILNIEAFSTCLESRNLGLRFVEGRMA